MSNDSCHNWLSVLDLQHVRSEALSALSSAAGIINTAVSHPNRGDPSMTGALWQLSHIFWMPWVLKLTQRERFWTDVSLLMWRWRNHMCITAIWMWKYASFRSMVTNQTFVHGLHYIWFHNYGKAISLRRHLSSYIILSGLTSASFLENQKQKHNFLFF